VYDIASREELDNALAAAKRHPELVVGLSIGNEVAFSKRATLDQIVSAVMGVRRRAPALALTTTEPFHMFLQPAAEPLLSQLDFMLVNVHPIYVESREELDDALAAAKRHPELVVGLSIWERGGIRQAGYA